MEQGRRKGNSMRGLPDSAVLGSYKRLTHKKRPSAPIVSYKEQGDFVAFLFWKMATQMSGKFGRIRLNKKGGSMLRNYLTKDFKYATKLTKAEKIIYTKIGWVVVGVLLFVVMIDASALGLALFFGFGWYAKSKYDLKKKVVRKPKKKVS